MIVNRLLFFHCVVLYQLCFTVIETNENQMKYVTCITVLNGRFCVRNDALIQMLVVQDNTNMTFH